MTKAEPLSRPRPLNALTRKGASMSAVQSTKRCPTCKTTKTLDGFAKDKGSHDGHAWMCKECKRVKDKKRTDSHRGNLYARWNHIRNRCGNPKAQQFRNYGGRGIKVCQEWADNFDAFFVWAMSSGYTRGLELDRIDNNKQDRGYSPENCRWVTHQMNMKNVRARTSSGFIGVLKEGKHRWRSQVSISGKPVYLGSFATAEEAARARDAFAVPLGFRPNLPIQENAQ